MPRGLIPEAFVQQSELLVWSDGMAEVHKQDTCGICHEAFSGATPDICRVLDCTHIFHAKCVDLWFIKATFCPLCKSDLKCSFKNTSSQRSLGGRSSHTSSQRSLGSRSLSSLRSGQILVGHSNSDPVLLQMTQERMGVLPHRSSPPLTPDRHHTSTASMPVLSDRLPVSFSERSLPVSLSPRTDLLEAQWPSGNMSSSSSGALPAVQEVAEGSQRSHSSNAATSIPASPVEQPRSARSSQTPTQTTPWAEPQAVAAWLHGGGHLPPRAPYQLAELPTQRVMLSLPPALQPRAPGPVRSTSASYVVPRHAPHAVIVATTHDPAPPYLLR